MQGLPLPPLTARFECRRRPVRSSVFRTARGNQALDQCPNPSCDDNRVRLAGSGVFEGACAATPPVSRSCGAGVVSSGLASGAKRPGVECRSNNNLPPTLNRGVRGSRGKERQRPPSRTSCGTCSLSSHTRSLSSAHMDGGRAAARLPFSSGTEVVWTGGGAMRHRR